MIIMHRRSYHERITEIRMQISNLMLEAERDVNLSDNIMDATFSEGR